VRDGIFNMHLTANFPRNLPVKKIANRLRFDRIMVMSLWPRFLAHPVDAVAVCLSLAKRTCRMTKTKPHDSPGNLFFSVAKDLGEIRLESPPDR